MSGISITCFAASYAVALALEITRLFFRSGVRGAVMLLFAGAGLIAQTLFLIYRALHEPNAPLSSEYDWYLIAAWSLMLAYFDLTIHHPKTPFGLFVLPLVLGLIGMAQFVADRTPFPRSQAAQIWGAIHGVFLLLGTVAVFIGFTVGVMALAQAYRLKHKLSPVQRFNLPSLEWLERLNMRAIAVSGIMLTIGFLSGIVLNVLHDRLHVDELPWNDPIVWTSGLLLGWMLTAAGFSFFYKPARQGRKVAYLTVASFVFLVLCLGLRFFLPTQHGSAATTKPATSQRLQRPEQKQSRNDDELGWRSSIAGIYDKPSAGENTGRASGRASGTRVAMNCRPSMAMQEWPWHPDVVMNARGGS